MDLTKREDVVKAFGKTAEEVGGAWTAVVDGARVEVVAFDMGAGTLSLTEAGKAALAGGKGDKGGDGGKGGEGTGGGK